jgi:DNA (cytosine-5)-methyltransferase 1
MIIKKNFTYVDLFAGIGGFHCAMDEFSRHRAKCVMACEIDQKAAAVYKANFELEPLGDIREVSKNIKSIKLKPFDVLCAGFPCQTFSKAGKQDGFRDPRGTLFYNIIEIINSYKPQDRPKILIMENVRNLITHDGGATWRTIKREIIKAGYNVAPTPFVVSPVDVGVPQLRDRAIILAVRKDIYDGQINLVVDRRKHGTSSVFDDGFLEKDLPEQERQEYAISDEETRVLDCWDDFIKGVGPQTIGFPIWSDYFGTRKKFSEFPKWKQEFVAKNQRFYKEHKDFIDVWLKKWDVRKSMTRTNRKFEWQMGAEYASVYDGIIQFRTSGVRVKRPTEAPALVAMVHRPILGRERRFITPKEAARLQSFPDNFKFNERDFDIYKQLGNAVNVKVVATMMGKFVNYLNEREGD